LGVSGPQPQGRCLSLSGRRVSHPWSPALEPGALQHATHRGESSPQCRGDRSTKVPLQPSRRAGPTPLKYSNDRATSSRRHTALFYQKLQAHWPISGT
jgi:hypothetical protein